LSSRKRPERVEFLDDMSPARWLEETLWQWERSSKGRGVRVGSLVSESYSSYGRIFHPAIERIGREEILHSWATIAEKNGRTTHPQMRYWRIAGMPEPFPRPQWAFRPKEGTLRIDESRVIVESLSQRTWTPGHCYFCFWEGWGDIDLRLFGDARLRFKHRNYLVFTGPIDAVLSIWGKGTQCFDRRTYGGRKTGHGAWQPR